MMLNSTPIRFQGKSPRHKPVEQDNGVQYDYVRMPNNQDEVQLARPLIPAQPGKLTRFYYGAMDLFTPTSLKAVKKASSAHMEKHLAAIDALKQPLTAYIALRQNYNLHPNQVPAKAPQQLTDAHAQCKSLSKKLNKHRTILEAAQNRHHVSLDPQLAAIQTAYQQSLQHLDYFQGELNLLFPKKKNGALDHAFLMLTEPDSIELIQVNTDLDKTKIALGTPLPQL